MVFHFLNEKFRDVVVLRDVYDMSDVRTERFYSKNFAPIIEFRKFHSDKTHRYKLNNIIKRDIRSYFCLEDMVIEMYVLEWCQDKTTRERTTYKNVMDL